MSSNTRNHQDPKFQRSKRRSKMNGAGDPPIPPPQPPRPPPPPTTTTAASSTASIPSTASAASPFQNIFDNVCRCFGHVPASSPTTSFPPPPGSAAAAAVAVSSGSSSSQHQQQDGQQQQQTTRTTSSSRETKKRTERLELQGREYDELFTSTDKNGGERRKNHPPRPEQHDPYNTKSGSGRGRGRGGSRRATSSSTAGDVEIAHAVAQAKLAANPPRYGGSNNNKNTTYRHSSSKRKRSPTQIRDDIFRNMNSMKNNGVSGKEQQQPSSVRDKEGAINNNTNGRGGKPTGVGGIPQPDFSRLLNPSLALCFATPIRGTEEEDEAASDVKSLGSDTNTLNTNGDDTITSTLYFDSKYAHIHETRPPMPLFNQFKVGMESDEIRNIVATDSHSSMKMMKLLQEQEQEQQRRDAAASTQDADDHAMSDNEEISTASKRSNADSNSSSNGRKGSRNIHDDPATVSTRLDPRALDGRLQQPQPNHRHIQSMSTIVQSNQRYPLNNSGSDGRTKSHRLQHNPHGPSTTAATGATTTSDGGYDDADVDMT